MSHEFLATVAGWTIFLLVLIKQGNKMTTKLSDLEATLTKSNDKLLKALGEIKKDIDDLTALAAKPDEVVSDGVQAQIDKLETTAQQLDDIVPDAPAPTAPASSADTPPTP